VGEERRSELWVVRHGQTEWSRDNRHTGTTDVDLTPTGEEQARRAGALLAGRSFDVVLASPLRRAQRTAQLAGWDRFETDPNLAEWDYGVYEGRSTTDIAAELGDDWNIWKSGTGTFPAPGESADAVGRRADAVIERLMPTLTAGGSALLFAHGHVLRILTARWLALPASAGAMFILGTGTISQLGVEHDIRVVERWNCA
jgi:probable phosphoglycerate mutase